MSVRSVRPQILLLPLVMLFMGGACVRFDPPQGNLPGLLTFVALGTATIDGQKGPGEWDKADCTQFAVKVPGGTTVNGDICMMNDGQTLYSMVSYPRTTVDSMLLFNLTFYTPGTNTPGSAKVIDQYQIQHGFPYLDGFPQSASAMQPDAAFGGTNDGAGAIGTSGGMHVHELSHPLDSADDAHDYSLKAGDSIWFCALVAVGSETSDFPAGCQAGTTGGIMGRVEIATVPIGGTFYQPDFAARICGIRPDLCPAREDPPNPHPCIEKPALCERPTFQGSGMFIYCTIKPCAVHDEVPRNCMRKFDCPKGPAGGEPPFYHMTFTGLNDDWDVVLVDRKGGEVPHRVVPIEGGVVISFRPDRRRHIPGLIGDYVAMFVMRDSGKVGVRYEVGARLATSDRHFEGPGRGR